jgi:hypothetical protein
VTLTRIGIVVAAALGFVACRPGEGDYCQCPGECRGGLVCAQSGAVIDSCIPPGPDQDAGRCIEQDGLGDMADTAGETAAPEYHDVGGKRDFEPGTPSDDSTTTTTTTTTSSSSASSSASSSSSSSGTGDATASSSSGPGSTGP